MAAVWMAVENADDKKEWTVGMDGRRQRGCSGDSG